MRQRARQVVSRAMLADISGCGVRALAWTVYGKVRRTLPEPPRAVRMAGAQPKPDASAVPQAVRGRTVAQQNAAYNLCKQTSVTSQSINGERERQCAPRAAVEPLSLAAGDAGASDGAGEPRGWP